MIALTPSRPSLARLLWLYQQTQSQFGSRRRNRHLKLCPPLPNPLPAGLLHSDNLLLDPVLPGISPRPSRLQLWLQDLHKLLLHHRGAQTLRALASPRLALVVM